MEQIKRQSSIRCNDYNDSKRQKTQRTTDELDFVFSSPRKTTSCLEDLSNELIYEIFEFLDYFHVYEAFFNLNIRFHRLVTNSNLPIKINLSSMSKSTFNRYNEDIIETNMHRINLLRVPDVFMYDFAFSIISKLSMFDRIETLILDNIESKYLENLFNQLLFLPLLSSLVINSVDKIKNRSTIYRQIVRLPALKYCKLSFEGSTDDGVLSVSTNEYSSIEHLIITNYIPFEELHNLLSYIPKLRRLSVYSLSEHWGKTEISARLSNHLTHLSVNGGSVEFDRFEKMVMNVFSTIRVLYFTRDCNANSPYFNANKWQQLITSHLPNLRVFDIQCNVSINNIDDQAIIDTQINQFTTSFWIERQWFFSHQFYHSRFRNHVFLYSTNPYRRKYYTLYKQVHDNTSLHHYESPLDTVQQIDIRRTQSIISCIDYFPNASKLIFHDVLTAPRTSMMTILNRIIPLKQLTQLVITCERFSVQKVIKILCCAPKIHTLMLKSMPCYRKNNDYASIEESQDFQLVSSANTITNVTVNACTLEQIKLLVALCPRLRCLTIDTFDSALVPITRFLLDKTNQNTRNLCSLCFLRVWNDSIRFAFVSAIPMIVYKDAQFDPTDTQNQLINTISVATQNECACQCYTDSLCITGAFIGINQSCTLYSASLQQGEIQAMFNSDASLISFPDRINNTELENPPPIIEWLFDGNFNDVSGRYDGTLVDDNTAVWISPGYNGYGSAVYLESKNYSLVEHYLNLTTTSFTISAWIQIPYGNQLSISDYFVLFAHCEYAAQDKCLHIGTVNEQLFLGFFADDLHSNTTMNFDQWYHVAYVYDRFTSKQLVYLNGEQDANRTSDNFYTGNASQLVFGAVPEFMSWTTFRAGYIDKLTFVPRIKTDDELLDEATLVAYYPFDNTYLDFGPNQIDNTSSINTAFNSDGRVNQSLVIGPTSPSYFQSIGFYFLCQSNYSYSFSMWIYPIANMGTILQVNYPNGWCVPMIGFNTDGYLTIQTLGSNGIYATSSINTILPIRIWTHVSMTYSIMNGIQLFVNGSWANSNEDFTDYVGSNEFCTIIIGTGSPPTICVVNQTQIIDSQFHGKIDELKIFSRELSASEVYQLASV